MYRREYEEIQDRLSRKLKERAPWELSRNRREDYERGILAAKSIIKSIYESQQKHN